MRRLRLILFAALALIGGDAAVARPLAYGGAPIPAQASAVGYTTKTFETSAFNASTVDTTNSHASGYQWYFFNMFGCTESLAVSGSSLNADGSLTTGSAGCYANGALVSGNPIVTAPYYVGTAFGGGGYFEAEVSFCMTCVDSAQGWPAWWAYSAEHMWQWNGDGSQFWPGQASGYEHAVEIDTFEALGSRMPPANQYTASLHDWYGVYGGTCPSSGFCSVDTPYQANLVTAPVGTDWTLYHRIGMRWVPATSSTQGQVTFWLDDVQVGQTVTWNQYPGGASPPPTGNWAYSWLDNQHLLLLFGGSAQAPLTVRRVTVWQASAAGNIHN